MRGRASLVVQRLRIQAAVPETPVQSWSGRIPHATEQLSPWATTTEPVPWGLALQLEKPAQQAHTARSPHSKKPAQQEARTALLDSSLRSDEDQAEPEINRNKHKLKKIKLEGARQQKAMGMEGFQHHSGGQGPHGASELGHPLGSRNQSA